MMSKKVILLSNLILLILTAGNAIAGPLGAPLSVSASTIPNEPLSLRVSWSPVENAEGYIVWICRDASNPMSSWDRLAVVDKTATSLVEDDIDPGRTYGFKVQAFNGKGVSPDSVVATISTPAVNP